MTRSNAGNRVASVLGDRGSNLSGYLVFLPVCAFALIILLTGTLGKGGCERVNDEPIAGEVLLIVVTTLSSLGCVAAALYCTAMLWNRAIAARVGAAVLIPILICWWIDSQTLNQALSKIWLAAIPTTVIALLALGVEWSRQRPLERVGSLLVFYLFGAASIYPLLASVILWGHNGGFCT